jgi:hypothetical protein
MWSAAVEGQILSGLTGGVAYVGQHSSNLLIGSGEPGNNTYGSDVNVFAGDLIQNPGCTPTAGQTVVCDGVQTRLNDSFGAIQLNRNGGTSNYEGLILSLKGRVAKRAFLTASYTGAESKDDTGYAYPQEYDVHRWYGPSPMDVRNRLSVGGDYTLPEYHSGNGVLNRVLSGWGTSGTLIVQSGEPFSVFTSAPFDAQSVNGGPLQFLPDSGDFRADGDFGGNSGQISVYSYPNVSSYSIKRDRKSYINGLFPHCAATNLDGCGPFSFPTMGTEGNEGVNKFRNPGFAQVDMNAKKITTISERVKLELRVDFFNVLNHVNLAGVDANANDGSTFGTSTSTQAPRQGQLSAKITF